MTKKVIGVWLGVLCLMIAGLSMADTADLIPETGISEGSYTTQSYDGRTVWVPSNVKDMLYFKVPASFDFVVGLPVYVRIEYHDSGYGKFFAEYDSNLGTTTAHKFWDSETHARSSRVNSGVFVYNYQQFKNPLFNNRQNGSNDFRFQLKSSDGTPLRVAGVQISTEPYDDAIFQLALSEPWLEPYDGEIHDFVDNQTLAGKVMTGYQGWFGTPNDVLDGGWNHWGRDSGGKPDESWMTIDAWPYLDDYSTEDLYPAGDLLHLDGRQAYLFSSRDPKTVQRHFRWMRKHGIDGAYLQYFVQASRSGANGAKKFVLNNVMEAASKEGRIWALEYDISGLSTNFATAVNTMTNDWNWMVNEARITEDPRYAHEDGKPVVFIWGFGVRDHSVELANAVIDWFASQDLYLICGTRWKDSAEWQDHFQRYDQLLIWMERNLSTLNSRKSTLDSWGMKILPHAWPGFSWHNLKMYDYPTSYTPRDAGGFYWTRLYNAVACGADQIFLGMFDEYDEGTHLMPMSDNHPDIHTEWGHYIDNEGRDPFWWLQLSAAGREMLNGFRPLSATLPLESEVPPGAFGGEDATVHLGTNDVSTGLTHVQVADGQTSGNFLGGHDCRSIDTGSYFYFDINNAMVFQNAGGQDVTVEIEFFDNNPGTTFQLQYDGLGASYNPHPDVYTSPGFGTWRYVRWNISDGYFGDRQNGFTDFRIAVAAGASIRRVSVFFPEEEGGPGADSPILEYTDGSMEWSVLNDAIGWRLVESGSLTNNNWQEVSGPFTTDGGMIQYTATQTNSAGFYKLQRPARQ